MPSHAPSYLKEGKLGGNEERVSRSSSERDSKIYRLAVPVLKATQNLVISSRSCVRTEN